MTGIDLVIEAYKLIFGKVNARVWQHNRPRNSKTNDIVISVSEFNSDQINSGYVDFNVYSKNPTIDVDGAQDTTFPNMTVFKPLIDSIIPLIVSPFKLISVGIPIRDNDGNWHVSIKSYFEGISEFSLDVELWSVKGVDDGYGGSVVNKTLESTTKASRDNIGNGTQLNIDAGRYEFNLRCDWLIPNDVVVHKNYQLHYNNEVYVINGIIPKGRFTQISTVRKDLSDED